MNFQRIQSAIDVASMQSANVAIFGAGASIGLILDLVRCGVQNWLLIDPDRVGVENMSRQGHDPSDIGEFKVNAVRAKILELSPNADVRVIPSDCTGLSDEESAAMFQGINLFIAATDSHQCQAYVNRLALMLNVPAVFIGLYQAGLGGEVVWIDPSRLDCCYRCLCPSRYAAHTAAAQAGESLDPPSEGADILSMRFVDAIAGQIIVGLLTQGADNRFGTLIPELGDRQFLQMSLSPDFRVGGRNPIQAHLGIADSNPAFFAWNTIAISDPDDGQLPCEDCRQYREHQFVPVGDGWRRIVPGQSLDADSSSDPVTI